MVESTLRLDSIFGSLADATRRDILKRVARKELSVGEVAAPYRLSLAAVSKHLQVLEKAKLIIKRRRGKQQVVLLAPAGIKDAATVMKQYEAMWQQRFDNLEDFLRKNP